MSFSIIGLLGLLGRARGSYLAPYRPPGTDPCSEVIISRGQELLSFSSIRAGFIKFWINFKGPFHPQTCHPQFCSKKMFQVDFYTCRPRPRGLLETFRHIAFVWKFALVQMHVFREMTTLVVQNMSTFKNLHCPMQHCDTDCAHWTTLSNFNEDQKIFALWTPGVNVWNVKRHVTIMTC